MDKQCFLSLHFSVCLSILCTLDLINFSRSDVKLYSFTFLEKHIRSKHKISNFIATRCLYIHSTFNIGTLLSICVKFVERQFTQYTVSTRNTKDVVLRLNVNCI